MRQRSRRPLVPVHLVLLGAAVAPVLAVGPRPAPAALLPPPAPAARPAGGGLHVDDLTTGLRDVDLVEELVGPGIQVSALSYRGSPRAGGIFTGGTGIIGFERGVVLSTGHATAVQGPLNTSYLTSWINFTEGDPDLDLLVPGFPTKDAALLEFDFECPGAEAVSFQFVFASEEYTEYVGSSVNDVFGLFVNGAHVPAIPGTTRPVSVQSVNCGNPYDPPDGGSHCAQYVDNDCAHVGGFPCAGLGTEMDGLTTVFTASAALQPGVNHMKIAIADTADYLGDSNVFVRGGGLDCGPGGDPVFEPPSPCNADLGATVGLPVSFDVRAIATNGFPGQSVSLEVRGSPAAIAGGTFVPPLPTPFAQPAETTFTWTPTLADVGEHVLAFTAVDQLGRTESCRVTVDVAECYLVLGVAPGTEPLPGCADVLSVAPVQTWPVTLVDVPEIPIPAAAAGQAQLQRLYLQVWMRNPVLDPLDPCKLSNALEVRLGGPAIPYGTPDGMHLWLAGPAEPGGTLRVAFSIDGL